MKVFGELIGDGFKIGGLSFHANLYAKVFVVVFSGHGSDGSFLDIEDGGADAGVVAFVVRESEGSAFIRAEGEVEGGGGLGGGIEEGLEAFRGAAYENEIVRIRQDRNVLLVEGVGVGGRVVGFGGDCPYEEFGC